MAAGGVRSLPEEEPPPKYLAITSCFERLVEKFRHTTKESLRDVIAKMYQTGAITAQQKEGATKTLHRPHLTKDYVVSSLFNLVLENVIEDDQHYDRMVLTLRELGQNELAEALQKALTTHILDPTPGQATELNGSREGGVASPRGSDTLETKRKGEEMSYFDSGIIAASALSSQNVSVSSDPQSYVHDNQSTFQPDQTHSQTSPTNRPRLEQQGDCPSQLGEDVVASSMAEPYNPSLLEQTDQSLQSRPQLQEPSEVDNSSDQQAPIHVPIQVHGQQSQAVLLVPACGQSSSLYEEISGSEQLIDQLSQRLTQMRLEVQQKEEELRTMALQNSELLAKYKELVETVKRMEKEIKAEKKRADRVSNDKNIEIISLRNTCREKEREIKALHAAIAKQEQEKEELTTKFMNELAEQREESAQKAASYTAEIASLNKALKDANQEKQEAEDELKAAHTKIQEAESERCKIHLQLMKNLLEKEQELSRLKDLKHKLELENQKLEIEKRDQQVLIHQKDKVIAEQKLELTEKKCECNLADQRRHSLLLQNENDKLKRQLSEYQELPSKHKSVPSRSETD